MDTVEEPEKQRRTKRVKVSSLTEDGLWVEEEESITCSEDEEACDVAKSVDERVTWGLKDGERNGMELAEKAATPDSLPRTLDVQKVDDDSEEEEPVAWGWINKEKIDGQSKVGWLLGGDPSMNGQTTVDSQTQADINGEASTRDSSRHDSEVECEAPGRVAYFPKKLNGKACLVPDGQNMWRALNYFLKASTAGLEFREAKNLDSKTIMDHVLTWGEKIEGVDEGDGWVRVQHPEDIQMEQAREEAELQDAQGNVHGNGDVDMASGVAAAAKNPSEYAPGSFLMLLSHGDSDSEDDSSDCNRKSRSRSRSPIRHHTRRRPVATPLCTDGLSTKTQALDDDASATQDCARKNGPRKMRGSVALMLSKKKEEECPKGVQLPPGVSFIAEISPEENLPAQVLARHVIRLGIAGLGLERAVLKAYLAKPGGSAEWSRWEFLSRPSGVKAYLEEKCRMQLIMLKHYDLPSFDAEIRKSISTKESKDSEQKTPLYAGGPLVAQNGMVNLPIPEIRFAHDAQREHFGHLAEDNDEAARRSVLQLVVEMLMGQTLPSQVPTFRVCRHDDQWYCHTGNRRLAAFHLAHHFAPERFRRLMVPIAIADEAFLHGPKQKLTTARNGPECLGRWMYICETGEAVGMVPQGETGYGHDLLSLLPKLSSRELQIEQSKTFAEAVEQMAIEQMSMDTQLAPRTVPPPQKAASNQEDGSIQVFCTDDVVPAKAAPVPLRKVPRPPQTPPPLTVLAEEIFPPARYTDDAGPKEASSDSCRSELAALEDVVRPKASPHGIVVAPPSRVANELEDVVGPKASSHGIVVAPPSRVAHEQEDVVGPKSSAAHGIVVAPPSRSSNEPEDVVVPKVSPAHGIVVTPRKPGGAPKPPPTLPPHLVREADKLDAVPKSASAKSSSILPPHLLREAEQLDAVPKRHAAKPPPTLPPHLEREAQQLAAMPKSATVPKSSVKLCLGAHSNG